MVEYSKWYTLRFGTIQPEWFVFPFGKPRPTDPTRPMVTLKASWNNVRKKAGVSGRWHDTRHTLITDLAESGAGDETIRDIAGHVSKQMLKHYSHIRMDAKRKALESIVSKADPSHGSGIANVVCSIICSISPSASAMTHSVNILPSSISHFASAGTGPSGGT
jgi:hypothetical protein